MKRLHCESKFLSLKWDLLSAEEECHHWFLYALKHTGYASVLPLYLSFANSTWFRRNLEPPFGAMWALQNSSKSWASSWRELPRLDINCEHSLPAEVNWTLRLCPTNVQSHFSPKFPILQIRKQSRKPVQQPGQSVFPYKTENSSYSFWGKSPPLLWRGAHYQKCMTNSNTSAIPYWFFKPQLP